LNFIFYRYFSVLMGPTSGGVCNKYDELNWNPNMALYWVQRVPIIKVVKVVEKYALCFDENYNTEKILAYTRICI
jgi:hypothetical protein